MHDLHIYFRNQRCFQRRQRDITINSLEHGCKNTILGLLAYTWNTPKKCVITNI